MKEAEYIDISNLARLRIIQSAMSWLLPMNPEERELFSKAQHALYDWQRILEKRTDELVTE